MGRSRAIDILCLLRGSSGQSYADKVLGYAPIAYWPLNEVSGTTAINLVNAAMNGIYARDVATMGTGVGIGDGNTAPLFDATNDVVDVYSAALAAAFDGAEGSLIIWAKVRAASVWADAAWRYLNYIKTDAANNTALLMRKTANANELGYTYTANGVTETETKGSVSTLSWMCLGMSWSLTANEVRYYYSGAPQGAVDITLGVWGGALLATQTVIGALNATPTNGWDGYLAHYALFGSALAPAAFAALANPT